MKKFIIAVVAVVLGIAVPFFMIEGIYSIAQGNKAQRSVTYQTADLIGQFLGKEPNIVGVYAPMFADGSELYDLVPLIIENAVGIGAVPFRDVEVEAASVRIVVDGCTALKPNLRKTGFYLRSNAYNPFSPPVIFYDQGKDLDPKLVEFFDRYGGRRTTFTTNEYGERRTLPEVERPKKVLVTGDSVAFGTLLNDDETIASLLQAGDLARQYVNLGVSGSDAHEILCRLEAETKSRYDSQIDELIYVYCENDLRYNLPYGRPEEVIGWLQDFAERQKIGKVTIVFAPYIYLVAPEVTRFRGYRGGEAPHRVERRQDLIRAVEQADFEWVDFGEIAREAVERSNSHFGFFPLYMDDVHPSPEGMRRLVERLKS